MSQGKFKVLVTHPEINPAGLEILNKKCDVTMCTANPPERQEILQKSEGMDGILWGTAERLDAEALDAAGPNLKAISTISADLDYVDIPEVKRRGIKLGHTPVVLNEAVGEMAIGLMIAATRRFREGRLKIESSTWEPWHLNWMLGQEISGGTAGFIGFGGTAQAAARRLKGFNLNKIIYYDTEPIKNEAELNATLVTLEEVLKQSDFLFVMCPPTDQTRGMLNESAFNKMKPNCVLINTGGGPIINQTDLYNALKNKRIYAAGIDVMTPEPLPANDPLMTLPNIIITPHIASASTIAREQMAIVAAKNVINGMIGTCSMIFPAYQL